MRAVILLYYTIYKIYPLSPDYDKTDSEVNKSILAIINLISWVRVFSYIRLFKILRIFTNLLVLKILIYLEFIRVHRNIHGEENSHVFYIHIEEIIQIIHNRIKFHLYIKAIKIN